MDSTKRLLGALVLILLSSNEGAGAGAGALAVTGVAAFRYAPAGLEAGEVSWTGGNQRLARKDGAWELSDRQGLVVARAELGRSTVLVRDQTGALRYELRDKAEGGALGRRLSDGKGTVLFVIRVKKDEFTVYDGANRRLSHGKANGGGVVLRDDKKELGRISGESSPAKASLLALPIDPPIRVLLWRIAE